MFPWKFFQLGTPAKIKYAAIAGDKSSKKIAIQSKIQPPPVLYSLGKLRVHKKAQYPSAAKNPKIPKNRSAPNSNGKGLEAAIAGELDRAKLPENKRTNSLWLNVGIMKTS
jgi:hypothetical protein